MYLLLDPGQEPACLRSGCYAMNPLHRKGPLFAKGSLLILSGIGAGVLASSLTSASIAWRVPSHFPMTEPAIAAPVDHGSAGRSWARTAFEAGLRRCPDMNAEFLAACQSEIRALLEKPKLAYSGYGGPLLITKVEPIDTHRSPEPAYDPPPPEQPIDPIPVQEAAAEPTPVNYPAAELPAH